MASSLCCYKWTCFYSSAVGSVAQWAECPYDKLDPRRGVGNKRNLIHLVEKSVEIKLKSWEIKADFLEIKLGHQPNPPAPPIFTTYDVIFEGNHGEIKEKSGNLVHQNCSLPTPRSQILLWTSLILSPYKAYSSCNCNDVWIWSCLLYDFCLPLKCRVLLLFLGMMAATWLSTVTLWWSQWTIDLELWDFLYTIVILSPSLATLESRWVGESCNYIHTLVQPVHQQYLHRKQAKTGGYEDNSNDNS